MNNPLDTHEIFSVDLLNPNPSSSKTKDGPVYRVSFELEQDAWQLFMDANTKGMILEMQGRVQESNSNVKVTKPKGGPISKNAGMFCNDAWAITYAAQNGFESMRLMLIDRCKITSRAELDHNDAAQTSFEELRGETWAAFAELSKMT